MWCETPFQGLDVFFQFMKAEIIECFQEGVCNSQTITGFLLPLPNFIALSSGLNSPTPAPRREMVDLQLCLTGGDVPGLKVLQALPRSHGELEYNGWLRSETQPFSLSHEKGS